MLIVLKIILFLDAIVLIASVLLQAGQGGGLASLGGGGGTEVFMGGRQATTILTRISWWCGGIFMALALFIAILTAQGGAPRSVLEGNVPPPAPVQPAPLPLPTNPPAGQQQQQPAQPQQQNPPRPNR